MGSNLTFGYRKEIAELEIANHLPAIHSFAVEVADGSLMSYGPDMAESYIGAPLRWPIAFCAEPGRPTSRLRTRQGSLSRST